LKCKYCKREARYEIHTTFKNIVDDGVTLIGLDDEQFDEVINVCENHVYFDFQRKYAKDKNGGWFYSGHIKDRDQFRKRYGKIDSVSFHNCNDYPLGLHLCFTLEDHGGVCWSFYMMSDIREFMEKMKVCDIKKLTGKVVETWWYPTGNAIMGVSVNENLV